MIKVILDETQTKRDSYGNVYRVVKVTNVRNNKYFVTSTPSLSNVQGILRQAMNLDYNNIYMTTRTLDTCRNSALPKSIYLDPCAYEENWKKMLNKIGFRCNKIEKGIK